VRPGIVDIAGEHDAPAVWRPGCFDIEVKGGRHEIQLVAAGEVSGGQRLVELDTFVEADEGQVPAVR